MCYRGRLVSRPFEGWNPHNPYAIVVVVTVVVVVTIVVVVTTVVVVVRDRLVS